MKKYITVLKCSPSSVRVHRRYNPQYEEANSEVLCHCGHTYYRHFDGYERDSSVHCKYCGCSDFIPYDEIYDEDVVIQFRDYLLTLNVENITNSIVCENWLSEILEILTQFRRGYAKHYLYDFNQEQIDSCVEWLSNNNIGAKKEPTNPNPKFRRGKLSNKKSGPILIFKQYPIDLMMEGY